MDDPSNIPDARFSLLPSGDNADMPLIELRRTLIVLGSRDDAYVQLKSHTVSRTHAVIVIEPWGAYVHDLASREGVFVNRQQVHDADLEDGDELRIGRFEFVFQADGIDHSAGRGKAGPAAHLKTKGEIFPLAQRVVSIGRRQGMDVVLDNEDVSSTHAVIYVYMGRHWLRDLNSRTGVFVNGRLLNRKAELRSGDVIRIGPTTMRYVVDSQGPPESAPPDDGMDAAMMRVAAADDPDTATPGEAAIRPVAPAQVRPSPADDRPTDTGDSATGVPAAPDGMASQDLASSQPSHQTVPGFCIETTAVMENVEDPPGNAVAHQPEATELHHVMARPPSRGSIAISPDERDPHPARLMPAGDHPLCDAAEAPPRTMMIRIEQDRSATATPSNPRPATLGRPTVRKTRTETKIASTPSRKPPQPTKSKYTASGEYRIDFDEDDEEMDPNAAMHRTAVSFMQDSIIGMPIAEVEAAPEPFTLGEVMRPKGARLPGLILSYRSANAATGNARRPPGIPPRVTPPIAVPLKR